MPDRRLDQPPPPLAELARDTVMQAITNCARHRGEDAQVDADPQPHIRGAHAEPVGELPIRSQNDSHSREPPERKVFQDEAPPVAVDEQHFAERLVAERGGKMVDDLRPGLVHDAVPRFP